MFFSYVYLNKVCETVIGYSIWEIERCDEIDIVNKECVCSLAYE